MLSMWNYAIYYIKQQWLIKNKLINRKDPH